MKPVFSSSSFFGKTSLFAVIVFFVLSPSARALVLLSDLRVVNAWSTVDSGQSVTADPFAAFNGTATTFGSNVGMVSTLSSSNLNASLRSSQFLDLSRSPPGSAVSTHVDALFQIGFRVDEPTFVSLTGYRNNMTLGGVIATSLTSPTGNIPLNWGGSIYNNYLDQTILLQPNTYLLTGQIAMTYTVTAPLYDGGTMRLDLNLSTVPDAGASAVLLAIGLGCVALLKRRRGSNKRVIA